MRNGRRRGHGGLSTGRDAEAQGSRRSSDGGGPAQADRPTSRRKEARPGLFRLPLVNRRSQGLIGLAFGGAAKLPDHRQLFAGQIELAQHDVSPGARGMDQERSVVSGTPNGMWGENGAVNGNGLPMVVADTKI